MKKVLLLTLGLLVFASAAFAQVGGIGLYTDTPGYVNCQLVDAGAALVPIYAVAKYNTGSTGGQWMLVLGGGWNCTYTGEIVHMPTSIGSTQAGISLGYGGCLTGDVLLVTINWFCSGLSPACAFLEVVPDPATSSDTIELVDCSFSLVENCPGSKLYVNNDGTCDVCGLPSQQTSWGKIKTLY